MTIPTPKDTHRLYRARLWPVPPRSFAALKDRPTWPHEREHAGDIEVSALLRADRRVDLARRTLGDRLTTVTTSKDDERATVTVRYDHPEPSENTPRPQRLRR